MRFFLVPLLLETLVFNVPLFVAIFAKKGCFSRGGGSRFSLPFVRTIRSVLFVQNCLACNRVVAPSRGMPHFAVEAEKTTNARVFGAFLSPVLVAVAGVGFGFIGVCLIFIGLRFNGFRYLPMV